MNKKCLGETLIKNPENIIDDILIRELGYHRTIKIYGQLEQEPIVNKWNLNARLKIILQRFNRGE